MKTITIMVSEDDPVLGKKLEMLITMPMEHLEQHKDQGELLLRCVAELVISLELTKKSLAK